MAVGAVATATDFNKYKRFKYENMWSSRLDPLALYSLYTAGCTWASRGSRPHEWVFWFSSLPSVKGSSTRGLGFCLCHENFVYSVALSCECLHCCLPRVKNGTMGGFIFFIRLGTNKKYELLFFIWMGTNKKYKCLINNIVVDKGTNKKYKVPIKNKRAY